MSSYHSTGMRNGIRFYLSFYTDQVILNWSDNRLKSLSRPVHAGEDPQEVMNEWKEELCN